MINVIDQDKCIGCGTCFKSCSLDVFRLDTDQSKVSPCMAACPAGTDIRGYNALVQQGKLEEAAQKLRQANPFPGITGRICFHPCEKECARNAVDGAVNINAVEQFLGDLDLPEEQPAVRHTAKVAVVGSGPAGLSCACFMARMGYPVTVFEAAPRPGGMLRYGIPAYRLPDAVVEAHVARLEALGVSFRCNTRIGKGGDLTLGDLRRRGYKAFLLAPGTSLSRRIAIEGAELPGVLWGVEFLRAVRGDHAPTFSGHVVVVGGGDVAVDAAISAKRLGASSVSMVSLESEAELPAYPHNIADARDEGIDFQCGWGPVRVEGTDAVSGLAVKACLSVKDASGAFRPSFDEAQTRTIPTDAVIFAIGQAADLDLLRGRRGHHAPPYHRNRRRHLRNLPPRRIRGGRRRQRPGLGHPSHRRGTRGSLLDGPLPARGPDPRQHRAAVRETVDKDRLPGEGVLLSPRNERAVTDAPGFGERRRGLDLHAVLAEGMRCMTCGAKARIAYNDDCMTCFTCELRCPAEAINVHPFKEPLPRTLEIHCED